MKFLRGVKILVLIIGALFIGFILFVPKPLYIIEKSPIVNANATVSSLQKLRKAIQAFKDDTGVYPQDLTDLCKKRGNRLVTHVNPANFYGPYLNPVGVVLKRVPV
ncbi:MAG TPA: hypothetical protein VHV83_01620 [Armatimonadota bacterium]|nr:hypothetical protein [Armatimonadota bacterium]